MIYKCDYCNYISDRKYNVTIHSKAKHHIDNNSNNDTGINKCNKCTKNFSSKYNLIRHSQKCNGIINYLQCQKCNKIFSCSSNRSRHDKICKVKEEKDFNQSIINNITNNNITNNITNNNTIIQNTFIFQNNPKIHPIAYQNYTMNLLSNDIIIPNKNNLHLMIEDFGRLIYKDDRNKNIKKTSTKTKYCLVKNENGEWCTREDKYIIPKVTKDIAYNFRIIIDDNEVELCNINKKNKNILPNLTEFLSNIIHYNHELEIMNDTDKEDDKNLKILNNKTICIIIDSTKS